MKAQIDNSRSTKEVIDDVIRKLTPLTDPQGIVTSRLKVITPHLVTVFKEAEIPQRQFNVISIGCGETANELAALIAYLHGIKFSYLGIDIDEESIERSKALYKNFPYARFEKLNATELLSSVSGIREHAGQYDLIILRHPYLNLNSPTETTRDGNTFKKIICDIVPRLADSSAILLSTHYNAAEADVFANYLKSIAENSNPRLSNPYYFFNTPPREIKYPERDTSQVLDAYRVALKNKDSSKAEEEKEKYIKNTDRYTDAYVFTTNILEVRSVGEVGLKRCFDYYKIYLGVSLAVGNLEEVENTKVNEFIHVKTFKPKEIDTERLFFTLKTQFGVGNTRKIMALRFDRTSASIILDQNYVEMLKKYHAEKSNGPEKTSDPVEFILKAIGP